MDLLAQVTDGFQGVSADAAVKQRALQFLRQWLTAPEFADYRPQLQWLIETKQGSGLIPRQQKAAVIWPHRSCRLRFDICGPTAGSTFPRRTTRRTITAASSMTSAVDSRCRPTIRLWPTWWIRLLP